MENKKKKTCNTFISQNEMAIDGKCDLELQSVLQRLAEVQLLPWSKITAKSGSGAFKQTSLA